MIKNKFHRELLELIIENSGSPTQHTFLDSYLGNDHKRYPINAPALRKIAKGWMAAHRNIPTKEFSLLLTSLIEGESSTEKCMAGILLDYATGEQRKFDPHLFDGWLDYLIGWAEVDAVCTGHYTIFEIPTNWNAWKKLLLKFSKSDNINKRRASLVFLCSPLRKVKDARLAEIALKNVTRLKEEKDILITRAISWVLRSMYNHYRQEVLEYIQENKDTLPKIAVRETLMKLKTGRKNKL